MHSVLPHSIRRGGASAPSGHLPTPLVRKIQKFEGTLRQGYSQTMLVFDWWRSIHNCWQATTLHCYDIIKPIWR